MRSMTKTLFLLSLLLCVGCTRASSDARRDHLLAGPHGWIDLTLHAPAAALAASAAGPGCGLSLEVNGEDLLVESGDLAQADGAGNPLGYRVVAPAGALKTTLAIDRCVKTPLRIDLPLTLEADHLALLEFDGRQLVLKATQPWQPATLDGLRADVAALHERAQADDGRFTTLTRLAIAGLAANLVLLAFLLARRR